MSPTGDRYELDLSTQELVLDPYRTYARLRANRWLHYRLAGSEQLVAVVSRYEDVRSALAGGPFTPTDFVHASNLPAARPRADLGHVVRSLIDVLRKRSSFDIVSDFAANIGAHQLAVNVIGNGMLALLTHHQQLTMLRRAPHKIVRAVDELLRFESPVQWVCQRAEVEHELPEGGVIRRGDAVIVMVGAANRDYQQFVEPDQLNLDRSNAHQHLAVGVGSDDYPGMVQVRCEVEVGIGELVRGLPGLHLASTSPNWRRSAGRRILESLPVEI